MPVSKVEKIKNRNAQKLARLGIRTDTDLLFHFPFRYEDFSHVKKIAELVPGESASIRCTVKEAKATPRFGRHMGRTEAVVSDDTGSLRVTWFNQPWIAKQLAKGDEVFMSGTVQYTTHLVMVNPMQEKAEERAGRIGMSARVHAARILPIYHATANLQQWTLRELISSAVATSLASVTEEIPEAALDALGLPDLPTAIRSLHFPETADELRAAERRMAFEEILVAQLAVARHRAQLRKQHAIPVPFDQDAIKDFLAQLPFTLTPGQKRALWEILQDMARSMPMNRLLEGDVGSGKTLVALAASLEALQRGLEVAILCPTEILAQQHYATAMGYLEKYRGISCILLTGKSAKINGAVATKKIVLDEIAHGGPHLVVGTHATIQKDVKFKDLALAVIDEQHRFGVRQRAALTSGKSHPHLLSMTATPIPRTLRLSLFGDLDVSEIRRKPEGRKPVVTKLVEDNERPRAYAFIADQLQAGRQAFVVTPLISEGVSEAKAATVEFESLKKLFPKFKIGLLHGKMAAQAKEAAMASFLAHETDILVSTTVVEVGVDVQNASVMAIEGAERFGLAQLHQLRGRVGRADHQSYCMLFTSPGFTDVERLKKFATIQDGFALAELDLQIRGGGNVLGEEQSGSYGFRFFSFASYPDLNRAAKEWAIKLLSVDEKLADYPSLRSKVREKFVHEE